jgi:hypothetical protein
MLAPLPSSLARLGTIAHFARMLFLFDNRIDASFLVSSYC